ncbi:transcriptional regulator [Agrobacterium tumefaciens]|uniref:HVO_A0114 family putative DNA-binding protein n=1 Tax=Agrobacterium tumefaciens TaxID=358 RepID=UPI00384D0444
MREALIQIRADSEAALNEVFERATNAMRSGNPSEPVAVFTFASPAQLFSVITPKRWELIEHLQKIGPSSIRGLARSVERDVKRVHEDVSALSDWGIFEQTEDGKVHVPYEVIHANFDLRAAT